MESAFITGMAAVLGSMTGASASIATTWMTQRDKRIRERVREEVRRRETLYGEFITEAARLTADAFDHSLERPETLANVYAIMSRIRLVGSAAVIKAAEECCHFIVDLYSKPNLTVDQIYDWLRASKHPLKDFAVTSRVELDHFA